MTLTISLTIHEDYTHVAPALRSLFSTTNTPCQVYVTVNTGHDPRLQPLKAEFPDANFLVNTSPQGFAANHNRIMRLAETEYVALLNDDILLRGGALDTLVAYLRQHPQAGLAGPSLLNPDGTPQVSTYSDPTLLRMLYKVSGLAMLTHQQSAARRWLIKLGVGRLFGVESLKAQTTARPVPIVVGVAMVVRRAAYREVGLMDESTLAYGEEADWQLRFRQAGWQVVIVPEARVTHFGMAQARQALNGQMLIEDRKAILNNFLKHRPRWEASVIRITIVAFHGFWGILWLAFSRDRASDHFSVARMGATWHQATDPAPD